MRAWHLGSLGVGVLALVVAARTDRVPPGARAAAATAAPLAVQRLAPAGRARSAAAWALGMHGYKILYTLLHAKPIAHRRRLGGRLPLRIDRLLGAGTVPSLRLQRALRGRRRPGGLDVAATALYASWFAEPHLILMWLLLRHPDRYAGAAARLGGTFAAMLPIYALAPSAPPWWSAHYGEAIPRDLERISVQVARALRRKPVGSGAREESGNPWASMPSDHFGTSVAVALAAGRVDRRVGALAWAYAAALGCALVYLGEHYVTDLAAGAAVAVGVDAGAGRAVERAGARPRRA